MRWEYDLEIGTFEGFEELRKKLNERGEEGWEAVGVTQKDDDFTVLLKRQKKAEGPVTW